MTRINCVEPELLHYSHICAEYRELPRVFGLVRDALARRQTPENIRRLAPGHYKVGTGHVLFFMTRLGYLASRHVDIVQEMLERGYNPAHRGLLRDEFRDIPAGWWGEWVPCRQDMETNMVRLRERMPDFYRGVCP